MTWHVKGQYMMMWHSIHLKNKIKKYNNNLKKNEINKKKNKLNKKRKTFAFAFARRKKKTCFLQLD